MAYTDAYTDPPPSREDVERWPGPVLLEFGTTWCGHCIAAQPLLERALERQPQLRHVKIEDGPGRRLGRSFRVKLWPTLVFLRDGEEVARLVRPTDVGAITDAAARLA